MAQFIFDIPDENLVALLDAVCAATGYRTESGLTKSEWVKEKGIEWFKNTAKRGLLNQSARDIANTVDPIPVT